MMPTTEQLSTPTKKVDDEQAPPNPLLMVRADPLFPGEVECRVFADEGKLSEYIRNNLVYRFKVFVFSKDYIREITRGFL